MRLSCSVTFGTLCNIHSVSGSGDLFLTLWRSCVVQCIAPCHAAYMTVINAIIKDIRHAKVLM